MKKTIFICITSLFVYCNDGKQEALWGSGTLEATTIVVSSQSSGTVVASALKEGMQLKKDQVMLQIDTTKLALQRQQVKASLSHLDIQKQITRQSLELAREKLDKTQKRVSRIQALVDKQSATPQQLDDVQVALKAAETQHEKTQNQLYALETQQQQLQAKLALVRQQISDTRIRAPLKSTVMDVYLEQGEFARPGTRIARLADLSEMTIDVYIPETDLGKVKIGQSARLEIDTFPERDFPATVVWVSEKAEFTPKNIQTKEARADLVYAVKLRVDNSENIFKIGMPADVYF